MRVPVLKGHDSRRHSSALLQAQISWHDERLASLQHCTAVSNRPHPPTARIPQDIRLHISILIENMQQILRLK